MEMFEAKLESLLVAKAYEALSADERSYVLQHLTESAYRNYHFILTSSIEVFAKQENAFVPDPDIPAILKDRFEAKFQPQRAPLLLNNFRAMTIYRGAAALAMVVMAVVFFKISRSGGELNHQKPKQETAGIKPVEITKIDPVEKPDKIKQLPIPAPIAKAKPVRVQAIKTKKEIVDHVSPELLGLDVYEPILCLDIDLDGQVPGLNDQILTN
jgi:hypothetical protein